MRRRPARMESSRKITRWQSKQIMWRPLGDLVLREDPHAGHLKVFITASI
jgi:hypothetical protein